MRTRCHRRWLQVALVIAFPALTSATTRCQAPERPAGDKGLPVSASAPSFMPLHLSGPHAGRSACPLCVHGTSPQLQIWVQEAHLQAGLRLAHRAEDLCAARHDGATGRSPRIAYVVLVPTKGGRVADSTVETVRAIGFAHVFFVQVPSWEDADTSGLYGHAHRDRPPVRVYSVVNRRVYERWDDPGPERWDEIVRAFDGSATFVLSHDLADAEVTPIWEPGERLEIEFLVVDAKGQPLPSAKVSAMQADASGLYNPPGWNRMTPRLSALAWTDLDGKVTLRTIRPGAYPSRTEPAHVHFSVVIDGEPQFRTLWFEGDPSLTAERRQWAEQDQETVIVRLDDARPPLRARHTFVVQD